MKLAWSENYRRLTGVALYALLALVLFVVGQGAAVQVVLLVGSLVAVSPLIVDMIKEVRGGNYGIDLLAVTAILASLALHEFLVATVILLMLTGGEALEAYAQEHAKKELSDLLDRAPKTAHRYDGDELHDVPVNQVRVGDRLLIKPGETVPVDAVVIDGASSFDEAAITGESLPVDKAVGQDVVSGSVNTTRPVTVTASHTSAESQYQQIVQLVRQAASSRSPLVRLADRYSVPFTIISLGLAGVAWALSGQALRALEVLVVATPCPLLLATPVAIVSGMSRAARHGIIVKSGAALEQLARLRAVAFDKTGTLTKGEPKVDRVKPVAGGDEAELLATLAALEQSSNHILAQAVVAAAQARGLKLPAKVEQLREEPGSGLVATVDGRVVVAGRPQWLQSHGVELPAGLPTDQTVAHVAIAGRYAGSVSFADQVRPETKATLRELADLGIRKTLMLTGDQAGVARRIAHQVGLTDVQAELRPAAKLAAIKALEAHHQPAAMVGDGVNDAPTLAAADVGIALGARGSTAASESADVVIMLDDLARVPLAIHIARRAILIANQSILVGIGLSIVLMLIAMTGVIPPVYGALLQEAVDVAVILNALRARSGRLVGRKQVS